MLDRHLIVQTEPAARKESMVEAEGVRITVLTDRLFRIEQEEGGHFCDKATQSVWYRKLPPVEFRREGENGELRISTGRVTLVWTGSIENSYVLFADRKAKVLLSNEGNLLGTCRTLDNCDGTRWIPYNPKEDRERQLTLGTGVVSETGVALVDDSNSLLLEEDGTLAVREHAERDVYVFAYGQDYRGAVQALYGICGKTPLIPRFALGNWWSRYHAYTEKEYLHTMDSLAERRLPFTVATVDMDWHWSETLDEVKQISAQGKNDEAHGGNSGWTGYSWNTELFPDYRRFLKELHERKLRVTLNLHPADGVRYFEDCYREMAEAMGIDPVTEEKIPFNIAEERFINAYFNVIHKPYEHDGVDFWWIDWQQGSRSALEGLDPLWALNHYHYLDNGVEHAPLILSRYCGTGSHRYPLGFSGDTYVTWDTMKYLPYFTATASNIGYTWWSHDIGGHMKGYKDDELYVRFVQFGVFSPINRLHNTNLPVLTKEPWAYQNGTGLIAEEYLRLRHRMIPFLYSASYETRDKGLALIEPMYYAYPDREEAYRYKNEYLFGGQMIVAPVTEKSEEQGMARIPVWLPEGIWTDFFTGKEYSGGGERTMVRTLDSMPVLIKEGGFFVLDDREYTNDTENPDCLKVFSCSGNGSYTLHEDTEGKQADTVFCSEAPEQGMQRLTICCHGEKEQLPVRRYCIRFCNIPEGEVSVRADGKEYPAKTEDNGRLSVTLHGVLPGVTYEIVVRYKEQKAEKREEAIRRAVTCLQMENDAKAPLYEALCSTEGEKYKKAAEQAGLSELAGLYLIERGMD